MKENVKYVQVSRCSEYDMLDRGWGNSTSPTLIMMEFKVRF